MIEDSNHPLWRDENLDRKLQMRLGRLVSPCHTIIRRIAITLQDLEEKSKEFESIASSSAAQLNISSRERGR